MIRCTPNHPVLSDAGFVRAKDIKNGDNLVCDNGLETVSLGKNINNKISSIEDVFGSLGKSGKMKPRTVEVSPEDFHGDVTDKEVEVIRADRIFPKKFDFVFFKKRSENSFIFRIVKYLFNISCLRPLAFFFKRMFTASRGGMCFFCHLCNLFTSRVLHSFNLLFFAVSHRNIIHFEKFSHIRPGISKLFSNSGNTDTDIVKSKNLIFTGNNKSSVSIGNNRGSFKNVIDTVFGNTELSRYIFNRHAGKIILDNVTAVHSFIAHTHVYNLETKDNWYIANGIINHNCRCILVPIIIGDKKNAQAGQNYKEWFERQPDEVKLDILGPARFNAYRNNEIQIKQFVRDGKKRTLKQLGIERATRSEIHFEENIPEIKAASKPDEVLDLYTDNLTKEQMIKTFKLRHVDIKLNIDIDKFTKENLKIVLSENDRLLTEYPEIKKQGVLKFIENASINTDKHLMAEPDTHAYYLNKRIVFNDRYNDKNWHLINLKYYTLKESASSDANSIVLHEFGHVINSAFYKIKGITGSDLLMIKLKNSKLPGRNYIAKTYVSTTTKRDTDFFAEAFTAWKNDRYSMEGLRAGSEKYDVFQFFNSFFEELTGFFF